MKYVGKLFGQIGRTRGYFDLGKTSEDWDALEARAERAEASLHALRLVCGTTDADKFTTWVDRANARAEEAEHDCRVLICQLNDAKAELAAERARLDAMVANCWVVHSEVGGSFWVFSGACGDYIATEQTYRAAIDAAMKEGA